MKLDILDRLHRLDERDPAASDRQGSPTATSVADAAARPGKPFDEVLRELGGEHSSQATRGRRRRKVSDAELCSVTLRLDRPSTASSGSKIQGARMACADGRRTCSAPPAAL